MDLKQLNLWVSGISTHSEKNGECCPDMSCCSSCSSSVEVRMDFLETAISGNVDGVQMYLYLFLKNYYESKGEPYSLEHFERLLH